MTYGHEPDRRDEPEPIDPYYLPKNKPHIPEPNDRRLDRDEIITAHENPSMLTNDELIRMVNSNDSAVPKEVYYEYERRFSSEDEH